MLRSHALSQILFLQNLGYLFQHLNASVLPRESHSLGPQKNHGASTPGQKSEVLGGAGSHQADAASAHAAAGAAGPGVI